MLFEGFAHNGLDGPTWIQAGIRVLENHLNAFAHGLGIVRFEGRMRVFTIKREATPGGLVQAHQQTGHRTFAATRFAHQCQCFAAFNFKTDAIDRFE